MAYDKTSGGEQVGYNLLAQRTQQLSNLGYRASNSFLKGNADDYFFTLIALRQNLTPNLNSKETRILNRIEKEIHQLKAGVALQHKEANRDEPGYAIISRFSRQKKAIQKNFMALYVEKIKKFEQSLLIVMKKKGFYPGKSDASSVT